MFMTKRAHQVGAVRVGHFNGIELAVLEEEEVLPGFKMTFLRYDAAREMQCRDIIMHVPPGLCTVSGMPATLIHGRSSGKAERR